MTKTPVCVLGLGLIGGSILRAAAKTGREAFGYNRSVEGVQAARFDGFDATSHLDEALSKAAKRKALIVLAVPGPALPILVPYIRDMAPDNPLTDVTSVKMAVLQEFRQARLESKLRRRSPNGGHDGIWVGCGRRTGCSWARRGWWPSTTTSTRIASTSVTELALDCGAVVVPARSEEHDAAAAAISHLPHLVAEAVAAAAGEVPLAFALAAGSFRDVTRVAATTPELVRAMCEGNIEQVLRVLDRTIELLTNARTALAQNGSVADLVDDGNAARTRYDSFLALRDRRGRGRRRRTGASNSPRRAEPAA